MSPSLLPRIPLLPLVASLATLASRPSAAAPMFMGFGSHFYNVNAISADGSTTVGSNQNGGALLWSKSGGFVPLVSPGSDTIPTGVSSDGSVVVGQVSPVAGPDPEQAFRWTSSGGLVLMGVLPGGFQSSALGVSGDGSTIVGTSGISKSYEAFRWTSSGGMVGMGFLPGYIASEAFGISSDGSTIVGYSDSGTMAQAVRWTSGGVSVLGLGFLPGDIAGIATGVSADGSTIVGRSNGASSPLQAFRWTSRGGMVGLGYLPGWEASEPLAVSADGSVVLGLGTTSTTTNTVHDGGFIWDTTHGMRDLTQVMNGLGLAHGWTYLNGRGIADDDQTIVGTGVDPSGQVEGWIATIPEPGTGLLLMAGVLGLAATRRYAPFRS